MGDIQQTLVDAFSNVKYLIGYVAGATGLSTVVVAALAISLGSTLLKGILKVVFAIFVIAAAIWLVSVWAG